MAKPGCGGGSCVRGKGASLTWARRDLSVARRLGASGARHWCDGIRGAPGFGRAHRDVGSGERSERRASVVVASLPQVVEYAALGVGPGHWVAFVADVLATAGGRGSNRTAIRVASIGNGRTDGRFAIRGRPPITRGAYPSTRRSDYRRCESPTGNGMSRRVHLTTSRLQRSV